MNPDFWTGKRVLITGHTGFKGSWMSLWLQRMGSEVAGFSRGVPTDPSLFEAARVAENMTTFTGDILDLDAVSAAVHEHRPEVVFHLAAQPLVRAAYQDPANTYATNVMGTVHVLEAVRREGDVRALVNITTDKVYENREWVWGYREDEALGGFDPYASSKACAEIATSSYRRSFFDSPGSTNVATARAGNVIGGGDWAVDRLVPDLIRGATAGRTVVIRNPMAIRPWQHVLNPLDGYFTLAEALWESDQHAGAWNFGPEPADARPVEWIADRLVELWGEGLRWQRDDAEHPHEAHYLRLDSSQAADRLGWRPRWGIAEAIDSIVAFARAEQAGTDLRDVVLSQIAQFEATGALSPERTAG